MLTLIRHLLSILLLPFMVTVVVPSALLRTRTDTVMRWAVADSVWRWLSVGAGAVLLMAGLALFAWCVALFARVGKGTLAPWDPTKRLVAVGPYRHVRNPMISAVALILAGEALLWRSGLLATWMGLFVLINPTYFLVSEDPGLERRFGDGYRAYRAHVPRWLPRLRPWTGADG